MNPLIDKVIDLSFLSQDLKGIEEDNDFSTTPIK